jgi:hypothetical protein
MATCVWPHAHSLAYMHTVLMAYGTQVRTWQDLHVHMPSPYYSSSQKMTVAPPSLGGKMLLLIKHPILLLCYIYGLEP